MECPWCRSANADTQKYCGECGRLLENLGPVKEYVDVRIERVVEDALAARLKDQKVVEIEVAQAVATRISEWLRLFGVFVGIPLGLLLFVLGLLGLKTFSDFRSVAQKAESDLKASAARETESIKQNSAAIQKDYDSLKPQLARLRSLSTEVETLSSKVDRLYDTFKILPASNLSPELVKGIEVSLVQFQKYLRQIGFEGEQRQISVRIAPESEVPGALSYFDPSLDQIVVVSSYATRVDFLFREYSHRVLYSTVNFQVDSEKEWAFVAIESGLANYFACSFNNDPLFGETTLAPSSPNAAGRDRDDSRLVIDLRSARTRKDIQPNISSAMLDGGEVWGATFWEIRKLLGPQATDRLLYSAWKTWKPADAHGEFAQSFAQHLLRSAESAQAGQINAIRAILTRRGFDT